MNNYSRVIICILVVQLVISVLLFIASKNISIIVLAFCLLVTIPIIFQLARKGVSDSGLDSVRLRELSRNLSNKNWELARLNEQLRIVSDRKSEFISIASHQLRTPLTALTGYLSMILEKSYGPVPIELNMPIARAHKSSVRLTNLVNELLHISRIEQGDLSYDITPIDVVSLIHDVLNDFRNNATEKNIDLSFNVEPSETPYILLADNQKLREVLHNLIDNALVYTPKGSVTINIRRGEKNTIVISIVDTGIGIAHEDIRLLFSKFQRGERGAKEFTDGSGLGLYISKKLISGMNGKIWIDSEGAGKGAEFSIELPTETSVVSKPN